MFGVFASGVFQCLPGCSKLNKLPQGISVGYRAHVMSVLPSASAGGNAPGGSRACCCCSSAMPSRCQRDQARHKSM